MSLRTSCPSCRSNFLLPATAAGRKIRCTQCGQFFVATAAEALPVLEESDNADDREAVRPGKHPRAAASPARRREPDDDWPRRRPDRPRRRGEDHVPLIIGLSLAGGVVLIAAIVGLAYWATAGRDRPNPQVVVWQGPPLPPPLAFDPGPQGMMGVGEFPGPGPEAPPFPMAPNPFDGGVPPGMPIPPPRDEPELPLPPFREAPNHFRAGTQSKLCPVRTLRAPDAAAQLTYSPKHDLLFLHNGKKGLRVLDVKAGKDLGAQPAVHQFHDMHLAPDESALFAVDSGGSGLSYVHRYVLAARHWERRLAPNIGYRVEVVDPLRFLLLGGGHRVSVSLNRWEQGGGRVTELAQLGANLLNGDMEYDPRTGRIYLGNYQVSSPEIHVFRMAGNKLQVVGDTGSHQTARAGGDSSVLASDGRRFYFGKLQVEAMNVKNNRRIFPEVILAASRDLAFGEKGYYAAQTGTRAGDVGFATRVQAVSPDGTFLWAFNPTTNELHQFAIEGETKRDR